MRFYVHVQPAAEGGFIVSAPALPGCVTQGETRDEALEMIRDAIEGYLASLAKHGEPVPPGIDAAEVEVIDVDEQGMAV